MNDAAPALEGPYVGLAPFEAAHADYFFGRTLDAEVLADNVLARPIVVYYGASGVGKSSVLNVGLPRALQAQGVSARIVLRREWHEAATLLPWLDGVLDDALAAAHQPLILVLDQFEEFFLYPSAEQVTAFARRLAALVTRTDLDSHVVLALRDDGLHRLDALRRELPRLLDTTLELRHLDEAAVREAITQPIGVWNQRHEGQVALDGDFADALIAQLRPSAEADTQPSQAGRAGGRIELAYLQLALERLWDVEGGAGATALRTSTLTERLKGVGEIARQHVEEVLGALPVADQALCATVFDRLVTPSGGKILYAASDLAVIAKVDTPRIDKVLAPLALGKTRLLRAVDLPGGRHARGYEILHDILARPILEWREQREAQAQRQRADDEAAARQRAENDRERIAKLSRWLVVALCIALGTVGMAGWAAWKAAIAGQEARASSLRAHGLRLAVEAPAVLAGTRGGGDERAMLQILAAERMASSPPVLSAMLDALVARRNLQRLIKTDAAVTSVAISPDGRHIVSGSEHGTLRLWDAATGQPVGAPFEGHKASVTSVAFSPDGRRIVSGSDDNNLRLWDAAIGQTIGAPFEGHGEPVFGVAFSPDGRRIVSGSGDNSLRLWDAATGLPIGSPLEGHQSIVTAVAFSPDGRRIVSGSGDYTLRLWDAANGQPIGTPFEGHAGPVWSVAFSADGRRIVSGSSDSTLRLWDAASGQPIGAPLEGHRRDVTSVAFSPDARRIVSAGEDMTLRLWDATTGRSIGAPLEGHRERVTGLAFSPDGRRIASASDDHTLRLWDVAAGESIGVQLEGHKDAVSFVAYSPDGRRIVSGGGDKTLRLWDGATGQPIGPPLDGHKERVTSVAFSADGRRIVSGSRDNTLRLWNADTGQPIGAALEGHQAWVTSVAFRPDGLRIVSGSSDNTLRLWDAATGQPIGAPFEGHQRGVMCVGVSADGQRIVSGSYDGTLRLWDAATGRPIGAPLEGHEGWVSSVAFSPDGRRIVSGGWDKTLRLWDAATGQPIGAPLVGHKDSVYGVAFSPDGLRIVSGSSDNTLRLWDTATGQPIGAPLEGHKDQVSSVAYGPDGRRIVSGSADNSLRLWPAPETWPDLLCGKLTRNMSRREWNEWVAPDIPYRRQCPDLPISPDDPAPGTRARR